MKNYSVTYQKGHLVDTDTGKRILLKRGGTFNLLGEDDQFEKKNQFDDKNEALDSKEKYEELVQKHKDKSLELVARSGEKLIYRIGIGLFNKTEEDNRHEFLFEVILLEDLFMMANKNTTGKLRWTLCDCLCETSECIDGHMQLYETIMGKSLTNLFSNMVAFYFPMQRSGVCNAFKTFFIPKLDGHKLNDVKFKNLPNLDWFRAQFK